MHHAQNAGYGAALRTGADRAAELGLEYVAFIDSDLTNPPEDLLKIGALAAEGHPYIKASRFTKGGTMRRCRRRAAGSRARATSSARRCSDADSRTSTNGFRAVRTELFRSWSLCERDFAVIVEELDRALAEGMRPVEFPTVLTARSGEQRPTAFSYSPRLVLRYLRYPLRASRRRISRR